MNTPLKVDPDFEAVIPALTDDEFKQLEANILAEGEIFTPIFVWNGFIVDGHHRHKILQKHPEIKYRISERAFENKYAAISWICNNQLGRRNLTSENKKYLIGKRSNAEKLSHGGERGTERAESGMFTATDKNCPLRSSGAHVTRNHIAQEARVSEGYVMYAEQYAKGVDAADEVIPGIKNDILSGSLKSKAKDVAAIAKAPPEARQQMVEDLRLTPEEKKSRREQREVLKNIEAISAELARPKEKNDVENVLGIIGGAADSFKKTCMFYISEFPKLLSEDKPRLIKTIDGLKQYVNNLYEGEQQ